MAIGRISGSMLKSNLTRNGVDLAFETNILYLDVTNARVGIGTSSPSTTLQVNGTTTTTGLVAGGLTYPTTDGSNGQVLTTNGSGTLSFVSPSAFGSITFVGDDSTGSTINTAETLRFTGGNNVTTSVVDDVVTITGTANINVNEISSTDSSAIQINDSVNISGALSVDTIDTTTLRSNDSSAIQVEDTLNVSGSVVLLKGSGQCVFSDTYLTRNLQLETATNEVINIFVTVQTKSTLNKWYGQGSASCYVMSSTQSPYLNFQRGKIYRFNQSDSSNSSHPINIYYDEYKSRAFPDFAGTSYVTQVGTAGTSGAYTELYVDAPSRGQLFYQCQNHPYMGGIINIAGQGDPIQFVSDDSTGFYVGGNESVRIAGGNSIDTTATQGVTDTITIALSNAITINEISSTDSTAIQINDGLNVSGQINMQGNLIKGVADPVAAQDVATKNYVDSGIAGFGPGTVTSITAGTGLTASPSNPITSTGTISLDFTTVVARVVGDDSTGTDLRVGETIKIAGTSNISTAVSGDTLTITGSKDIDINSITSSDSSAIQINDAVNVSGLLTANAGLTINNNSNTWLFGSNGATTLPAGGTITEGVVTSNPTIQLTPATPTVASQKLVIKGGGSYSFTTNGININYYVNTGTSGDTLTFYVYSNTYADQTLYWWIYPVGVGMTTPDSGTVVLSGAGGNFSVGIDSDAYEFTVRVSPEADNYNAGSIGVESGLINADAPPFTSEHHLHLTTGNLTETSIFLGTDDHNVRTTTAGNIQITTPNTTNKVWEFGTNGSLTFPDSTIQNTAARITVVGDDSTGVILNAGETIKIAGAGGITTAVSGDVLTITGANQAQGITVVGDDSTGTRISDGETLKIAGDNNITAAMSGDILTITGSKDINVNSISSGDSTAIQINDGINVSGTVTANSGLVANGITYPTTDGSANQVLVTNGAGTLSFTNLASFVGITFVGDDSSGSTINTAETVRFVGATGITTSVVDDVVTITGPNLSSYLTNSTTTIVGDDSTGTTLNSGETIKFAGATGITTAVTGDTLTITGPDLSSYLTAVPKTIDINQISSGDSTAIQINDAVNISGILSVSGNKITNVSDPVSNQDAATKNYVDSQLSTASTSFLVADDTSTVTTIDSGSTFRVIGAGSVTTSLSGDTITITGAGGATNYTFIGDDSTGTTLAGGSTLQVLGGEGISTAVMGNVLTITNTSTQMEIDGGSAYSIYNSVSEVEIDGGNA